MIKAGSAYGFLKISAALITGCFFLVACENDQKVLDALNERKQMVEEGRDIESYLSQAGVLRAKLRSPLMLRYQADTVFAEFPKSLYVEFYDSLITVESWLTANYGKYYEQLNKVYLKDKVTVINRDGDTLRTSELWWDQNKQKFFTDKLATLDGKDKHIVAHEGLDATQDLKVLTFHYPTGPFQMKEGSLPQ